MLRVAGSSPSSVIRSPQPTSSIEPIDTKALKPTFWRRLQSSTAVQIAPDWLRKPTCPAAGWEGAKLALRPLRGFIRPRQLGPSRRMPDPRSASRSRPSSAAPSGPTSRKPAEITIAARAPAAAQAATTSGTPGAGVAITARSTRSGSSATLA